MTTDNNKLYGVGCDVINCKYHGPNDICSAEAINVESRTAAKKVDTFCGTFTAKSGTSM